MGLSPEQFIQLEQIKMQEKVCTSANCTMLIGGGSAVPLVNLTHK
jgi:hypothetical protein